MILLKSQTETMILTPATIIEKIQHHVCCLECGAPVGTIDHLPEIAASREDGIDYVTWGPWYCDKCGASIQGQTYTDGRTLVRPGKNRKEERAVLLRYSTPMADTFYLVVKGMRFHPSESEEEERKHDRYFYEEHTCPINYLRDTLGVILGSPGDWDEDPHGLFEYVGSVPLKGNESVLGDGCRSITGTAEEVLQLFGMEKL